MAYQSAWITKKDLILAAANRVKTANPVAWEEVKVPGQTSRTFISLVAAECQQTVDVGIGCNLKRGGPETSLDVLAMPNASGARDATGTFLGLELIDIIGSAEGPDASIAWGDVTQKTIDSGNPGGWIKSASSVPGPTPPPAVLPPGREEALDEQNWLHNYYMSPEGLQRPKGLWRDDTTPPGPDFEGISAWYLDVYQRERMAGKSRTDARAAYVTQIRHSAEWQAKHPGVTP